MTRGIARARLAVLTASFIALGTTGALAEPMYLAKQYARCSTCHYSPTGGGLLTPYGRSLSHQELSTTGRNPLQGDAGTTALTGEEAFLYGMLKDTLGPVQLGVDLRPSRLEFSVNDFHDHRNLLMTLDALGAYRFGDWTLYGEIGREPQATGAKVGSYEYWVGHQSEKGFGFRVGRFLPAYGIRFADHTAFNRSNLGFDKYDQVFGVEVSRTSERTLMQVSVGPGRADSIIDDDGRQAFTATGRVQIDLSPRTALVASALYRDPSDVDARNGAGGVAFGFAPTARLNVWTEVDSQFRAETSDGHDYVVVNETAFEAIRGVWLKFSPQFRTVSGRSSDGIFRMVFEADLLPRTHWNIDLSYYRDDSRSIDLVTHTLLAQLHMYL